MRSKSHLGRYLWKRKPPPLSAHPIQENKRQNKRQLERQTSPFKVPKVVESPLKSAKKSYSPAFKRFKSSKSPWKASPLKIVKSLKSPIKTPLFHPKSTIEKSKSIRTLFGSTPSETTESSSIPSECASSLLPEQPPSLEPLYTATKLNINVDEPDIDDSDESTESISFREDFDDSWLERYTRDGNDSPHNKHTDFISNQLIDLVPSVVHELSKVDGMDQTLLSFFELVHNKTFPLDNTAFLLWVDVVKWFSCSSTTAMRYSDKTKMFWKLGWRIFGKRFINFMGGFKNHGETVTKYLYHFQLQMLYLYYLFEIFL